MIAGIETCLTVMDVIEKGIAIAGLFQKIAELIHKENCHHHLFEGSEHVGDICLQKYDINQDHDRLRKIHKTYHYPEDGKEGVETIHGIFCYDHRGDDRGGKVWISDGGVGAKHVEIQFESMVGRAIDYTVVIIGQ
ncbi:hypothetical protein CHUAL_008888 [Chamberlinius hualienensis]